MANVSIGSRATLSLHVGEFLWERFRSKLGFWSLCKFRQNAQIGSISGIDLGGLSIGFFCSVVSFAVTPSAMEGI